MLTRGQIIEIVTHEEGRLHIRRVKLDRVRRGAACGCCEGDDFYHVEASNLLGKYRRSYRLPLEPIDHADVRNPEFQNCVNWITCEPAVVADL